MLWPKSTLRIASLGRRALGGASIAKAEVVGGGKLAWKQEDDALVLTLPPAKPGQMVPVVHVTRAGPLDLRTELDRTEVALHAAAEGIDRRTRFTLAGGRRIDRVRSEEHTSELQSIMRLS